MYKFFHINPLIKKSGNKGFTLIELMLVSAVYLGIIVAIWGVLLGSLNQIGLAREVTLATDDLKDVMEVVRSVAFSNVPTVFPDGTAVDPDLIGGFQLKDESIVVSYPDGPAADPLEIRVEITWTSKSGRTISRIFKTVRTSRI